MTIENIYGGNGGMTNHTSFGGNAVGIHAENVAITLSDVVISF